jgi:hypothetical protein
VRFEAAMTAARAGIFPRVLVNIDGRTLRNSLGFETGDVAAPPVWSVYDVSRESLPRRTRPRI